MTSVLRSPFTWIGLGIAVIVFIQITAPKPFSWEYTYEADDKNPYGGWIPSNYLDKQFPGELKTYHKVLWAEPDSSARPTPGETHVVITHKFSPDPHSRNLLLDFVNRGGTLFVASDVLGDSLKAALGVTTKVLSVTDTIAFRTSGSTQKYGLASFNYANSFRALAPDVWHAYAYCDSSVVLAVRAYGAGEVILCGTPDVLTNKAFLDNATRPIGVTILSTLPDKPVVWDEYYKPKHADDISVNRAIGSIPGLSLAYWLLICTGVVYLFMAGRRRQRAIPVLQPVRNTSLDFVSTVGRLYFRRHDNLNLANKLARLFRDYVVHRLRLRIDVDAQTLAENISNASGVDVKLVEHILKNIEEADKGLEFSDEAVVAFHNDIQQFQQLSTIGTP